MRNEYELAIYFLADRSREDGDGIEENCKMRGRCSVQFSGGGNSWLTEYHQETSMQDELRNDEILTLMIEGKINRIRYEERQIKWLHIAIN